MTSRDSLTFSRVYRLYCSPASGMSTVHRIQAVRGYGELCHSLHNTYKIILGTHQSLKQSP